jgi:hypothetical protein
MQILFSYILLLLLAGCTTPSAVPVEKTIDKAPIENNLVVSYTGTIIEKTFVNKGGKVMENIKELYFKISEEEIYFIKYQYTEGSITSDDLQPLINQTITINGQIIDGLWDVSEDNPYEAQSRIGKYLVIFSIQ